MAKYRIWLDHPESDCYCWASDIIHSDLDEAQRELEVFQDTGDLSSEFTIINLSTGYPWYINHQEVEALDLKKRE